MWLAVFAQQIKTLITLLNNEQFRNDPVSQRYVCEILGELLRWIDLYGPHNIKEGVKE